MKLGGGKAYMKLKRYERGIFDSFSKRGCALYKAYRRVESNIPNPKMMSHIAYVQFLQFEGGGTNQRFKGQGEENQRNRKNGKGKSRDGW